MAEKKKRLRPTQLHFYVNDQELDLINQMKRIGNEDGTVIGRHPLSPAVRRWKLYKVKCGDKTETEKNSAAKAKTQQKKKKER